MSWGLMYWLLRIWFLFWLWIRLFEFSGIDIEIIDFFLVVLCEWFLVIFLWIWIILLDTEIWLPNKNRWNLLFVFIFNILFYFLWWLWFILLLQFNLFNYFNSSTLDLFYKSIYSAICNTKWFSLSWYNNTFNNLIFRIW